MAGTALHFDSSLLTLGYGWFWFDMAIPGAGARATLFTDGTPDATANPSAKHLGHTDEGWEMKATASREDQTVDEQVAPVETAISALDVGLAANLVQTQDISGTLRYLVQGFGSYSTAAGYEQITGGIIPIVYSSVALIFPTRADVTKFMVYQLYKSLNDSGLTNQIRRRTKGNNPVAFKGYAVTSRAASDTTFNFWKQI